MRLFQMFEKSERKLVIFIKYETSKLIDTIFGALLICDSVKLYKI